MKTKTVAAVSAFAALTVALNLWSPKMAAPFAPFLYYQIWEIPIVVAFLLYGPSIGIAVSVINTLVLLAVFPGALPTGPLYNLAAILGMFLGIYVAYRFRYSAGKKETVMIAFSTALGIVSRVIIMSIVNWTFLRYPYPIGFNMAEEALVMMLPIIGLFNATLALYTIPMGYVLARAISSGIKIGMWNPKIKKD